MNKLSKLTVLFVLLICSCTEKETSDITYRDKDVTASKYDVVYESGNWEHPIYKEAFESFGNQRAVIQIENDNFDKTQVTIPWRRRDHNPEAKDIIIVDAKTNLIVTNKHVVEINNEFGHIVFQPNQDSKTYYAYYFPHESTGSYYPKLNYKTPTQTDDEAWLNEIEQTTIADLPKANVSSIQSIDNFNSFFPMEVIATQEEVSSFISSNPQPYYLFPEYRNNSIKLTDYLPVRWIKNTDNVNGISDEALRGEYYTFQIGVFSPEIDLNDLGITFSDLNSDNNEISKEAITCFNKGGVDLNGKSFKKTVSVSKGKTQALWFGIEIPETAKQGIYKGSVIIKPENSVADTVYIKLNVSSEKIENYGDGHPENMSRLRWLNSTIGTDENFIIKPFTPVNVLDKTLSILGRDIELNNFGLPNNIDSYFTLEMTKFSKEKEPILKKPIQFNATKTDGSVIDWTTSDYSINQTHKSAVNWKATNRSDDLTMSVNGTLEYDGMLEYNIQLTAENDINLNDVNLQIPMQKEAATYILGLGEKGSSLKSSINWKWDVTKHHEGAWLGGINKGLQFVLRDKNYERPLNTNFYQAKPLNLPPSWHNEGKGGIDITMNNDGVLVKNYSGARTIKKGDTLNFNIRFLITPFKLIDTEEHFNTRFVHKYVPVDSVINYNGTIANVHHANEINPYINYPFFNLEKQKAYIDEAHSKGIRVKLYNTIRELTYKSHELFALKSLGDEILNDGLGGGHSWMQEHLKSNYHSAWHATEVNDASILNKGTSRWTNYYIEGINWLAKNQEIDGLYLDDIAFSRSTVKRIASVFDTHRDSFVIDLHSANQYNNRDGFINSAFLYMEHFPYISRLWFGEYFEYDLDPDYWLTEVSGIPFGLTGEMLEKGGHPYRGLVYGMTTRVYGNFNPGALWELFDSFDIANAEMLGYWVDRSPIKTNHPNIKSTVYVHDDKILIAIGSWSNKNEQVILNIDWKALGFDENSAQLSSPEIKDLQHLKTYDINKPITIEKNQGLILVLKKNN
ncbi:glycoside hydrolase domain-containing protein [Pontimicrobium sp. SW4]|uniref:Glycoside hydrolase domain-containing protein n=1 Tax=Pontimicrobium sp. SW4 TaxID=3153519 RepID=A0AAU7BPE4_9FLAO